MDCETHNDLLLALVATTASIEREIDHRFGYLVMHTL